MTYTVQKIALKSWQKKLLPEKVAKTTLLYRKNLFLITETVFYCWKTDFIFLQKWTVFYYFHKKHIFSVTFTGYFNSIVWDPTTQNVTLLRLIYHSLRFVTYYVKFAHHLYILEVHVVTLFGQKLQISAFLRWVWHCSPKSTTQNSLS